MPPMTPGEAVTMADAVAKLTGVGLLFLLCLVLGWISWKLFWGWMSDRLEASRTYIGLLRESHSDENRQRDLIDDLGKTMDAQVQATRDLGRAVETLGRDMQGVQRDLVGLRSDVQRPRI